MEKYQVAWSINAQNSIVLVSPYAQTPPYTPENTEVMDLSVGVNEKVYAISSDRALFFTGCSFPFEWNEASMELKMEIEESDEQKEITYEGKYQPIKLDVGPESGYVVVNNGILCSFELPDNSTNGVTCKQVEGIENVIQISAAADGKVWAISNLPDGGGTVVSLLADGKWTSIDQIKNAIRVTGTIDGKVYIVDSAGSLSLHSIDGESETIPFGGYIKEISVGPDGRLWIVTSIPADEGGCKVLYTDDKGGKWNEVGESGVRYLDAGLLNADFEMV